jgi:hypothetical protein
MLRWRPPLAPSAGALRWRPLGCVLHAARGPVSQAIPGRSESWTPGCSDFAGQERHDTDISREKQHADDGHEDAAYGHEDAPSPQYRGCIPTRRADASAPRKRTTRTRSTHPGTGRGNAPLQDRGDVVEEHPGRARA